MHTIRNIFLYEILERLDTKPLFLFCILNIAYVTAKLGSIKDTFSELYVIIEQNYDLGLISTP